MKKKIRHRGRLSQTIIYLGKLFRMFLFQNDWKVLPMSAIIAGLVCFAVGSNLYKTMEGTLTGAFALACVCVWNGFFNSIVYMQREGDRKKRAQGWSAYKLLCTGTYDISGCTMFFTGDNHNCCVHWNEDTASNS